MWTEILFEHLDDDLLRAEICATRLVQSIGRANGARVFELASRDWPIWRCRCQQKLSKPLPWRKANTCCATPIRVD